MLETYENKTVNMTTKQKNTQGRKRENSTKESPQKEKLDVCCVFPQLCGCHSICGTFRKTQIAENGVLNSDSHLRHHVQSCLGITGKARVSGLRCV